MPLYCPHITMGLDWIRDYDGITNLDAGALILQGVGVYFTVILPHSSLFVGQCRNGH